MDILPHKNSKLFLFKNPSNNKSNKNYNNSNNNNNNGDGKNSNNDAIIKLNKSTKFMYYLSCHENA